MTAPNILALDPGTERTAYVQLVSGEIAAHGIVPNAEMLRMLDRGGDMSTQHGRPLLAVEMIASYGLPVGREVFETCVWIGRFVQVWHPWAHEFVYRKEVKLHLCYSARAKDPHVRQALIDLYGKPGTKAKPGPTYGLHGDEWAALGVAETMRAKLAEKGKAA